MYRLREGEEGRRVVKGERKNLGTEEAKGRIEECVEREM